MTFPGAHAHRRRTKIVATLGPASATPEMVRALIAAGMDVARINGSHGSQQEHAQLIATIRAEAEAAGVIVGILFDLQGPKIRLGRFADSPRQVHSGQTIVLACGQPPQGDAFPCDYSGLADDVAVGQPLLIDDGKIAGVVVATQAHSVHVRLHNGGSIAERKGINVPDSPLAVPALSDKDRSDALFAARAGVDMLALSFVRQAADVEALRTLLAQHGFVLPIVAKIEKPQALHNLDEILQASWGVMVARGDLGVELSMAEVPMAQKHIIAAATRMCRPVITATQMLESMIHSPRPTRAEASDVANAVLDGTDAVMLSAESASGAYPVHSVQALVSIIEAVERTPPSGRAERRLIRPMLTDTPAAIAHAGGSVANEIGAVALVVYTQTGRMARLCSQRRPQLPIVALSESRKVCQALALVWGVSPAVVDDQAVQKSRVAHLDQTLAHKVLAKDGDAVVVLVGAPRATAGSTNLMLVHHIGENDALGRTGAEALLPTANHADKDPCVRPD